MIYINSACSLLDILLIVLQNVNNILFTYTHYPYYDAISIFEEAEPHSAGDALLAPRRRRNTKAYKSWRLASRMGT